MVGRTCATLFYIARSHNFFRLLKQNSLETSCADSEGGTGGQDPPPPLRLSEVGSCVDVLWVGEGVHRLFLSYYYNFFLARFARQYFK